MFNMWLCVVRIIDFCIIIIIIIIIILVIRDVFVECNGYIVQWTTDKVINYQRSVESAAFDYIGISASECDRCRYA